MMHVHLLHRDRDFNLNVKPSWGYENLREDLTLGRIIDSLSDGDEVVTSVFRCIFSSPLRSSDAIVYRQESLKDAMANPETVEELYALCKETEEKGKAYWNWFSSTSISCTFSTALGLLEMYLSMLEKVRSVAVRVASCFHSEGFRTFFDTFEKELSDASLKEMRRLLALLRDPSGLLISAEVGSGMEGVSYVLREKSEKGNRLRWRFAPSLPIAERDDRGAKDVEQRKWRALFDVTGVLSQAAENLEHFFRQLRQELAFFKGCLQLKRILETCHMPVTIPNVDENNSNKYSLKGMYDVSLVVLHHDAVVANDVELDGKSLVLVTGANQGGKTTFLKSFSEMQLMASCGMFVGASSCRIPIRPSMFTHFKRGEDETHASGKLDEELERMGGIVDHLEKGSLVLMNESFSSTNEKEGSRIAKEITSSFLRHGIFVVSVTHLLTYADAFLDDTRAFFLKAQRLEDGGRTFQMLPGIPEKSAYGEDLLSVVKEDW